MASVLLAEDWEFNILDVYNYRRRGPLEGYFEFVREHHAILPGDLLEAGVYRGRALLSMALMLKELGSTKKIYGYDTWSGFPPVHSEADRLERWQDLLAERRITPEHFDKTRRQALHRTLGLGSQHLDSSNISLSGNFSSVKKDDVEKKAAYLGLDNIVLVEGPFLKTMTNGGGGPTAIMAALIDADLHASYAAALPYIWARVVAGGYIYLDEYYSLKFPGARIACDEFFAGRCDKPQRHARDYGDFERWYVRKIFDVRG